MKENDMKSCPFCNVQPKIMGVMVELEHEVGCFIGSLIMGNKGTRKDYWGLGSNYHHRWNKRENQNEAV